jgi:hypothetical protein
VDSAQRLPAYRCTIHDMSLRPLASLRRAQLDVVTRTQLRRRGIGHDVVAREVLAGRWQLLGPRVVVLHNGPITREQLEWAAVLNSGGALAGVTGAASHGLVGYDAEQVHVVVPRGAHVPRLDGVIVHESRRFDATADCHPLRRPRVVRVERAVVDAATWAPTDRRACALLAATVQQRLSTASRLQQQLSTMRRPWRGSLLFAVLGDIEGGAQALSELDFVSLCRRNGLPMPLQQAVRVDAHGRRRFLDARFRTFSAEVDGMIHLRPLDAWADAQRHNALLLVGERQLRFPSVVMRIDEPAVVADLRRAFEVFGYDEAA